MGAPPIRCELCEREYRPTRLQLWKLRREAEARRWHEACGPANFWGGAAVVLVTGLLLFGMFGPFDPEGLVSNLCFWLLPLWCTTLFAGAMLLYRLDRSNALAGLRRSVAVVLALLLLPFLYQSLPLHQWAGAIRTRIDAQRVEAAPGVVER